MSSAITGISGRLTRDPNELYGAFIRRIRTAMRSDLRAAEECSAAWEARRALISERCQRKGLDVIQERQDCLNDTELKDLMESYNFFRGRHEMYALHLMAELALNGRPEETR